MYMKYSFKYCESMIVKVFELLTELVTYFFLLYYSIIVMIW